MGVKMTVPEKVIENQILTWLFYKRIFAWKNQSTGIFDRKRGVFRKPRNKFHINGVSDIIAIINGQAVFIEVKSKTGKLSEDQEAFGENVTKAKGKFIVARSIEDVERELEGDIHGEI